MVFRIVLLLFLGFLCSSATSPEELSKNALAQDDSAKKFLNYWPETNQSNRLYKNPECPVTDEGYTVNFENISVLELLQFISQISGINFIFDQKDLQFSVTILSEKPTSAQDLLASLIQILKTHQLSVVEQGQNVLIFRNELLSRISTIITDNNLVEACDSAVVTRVFQIYNVSPERITQIIQPLLSRDAIIEVSPETHHLIITDITANVNRVADLLQALDAPNSQLEVRQFRVKGAHPEALVAYAKEILAPLMKTSALEIVAQPSSNKVFLVSTPFLLEKAIDVLSSLDESEILSPLDGMVAEEVAPAPMHLFYMYKLKFHNGKKIADALTNIGINLQAGGVGNLDLITTISSVQWLEANNSLVISGTQDSIDKVIALIDDLDQMPKQVYIEVLIIDTTLRNSLDFGVQWIALGDEQNKLAFASGLLNQFPPGPNLQGNARAVAAGGNPPPAIPNPGANVPLPSPGQLSGFGDLATSTAAFGLGIVGNIVRHNGQSFLTLGALVSALEEDENTVIVLNPRIMTEDTREAKVFVGQNIPYQTTSTVIQEAGSVTQNVQYEDVGVELRVRPNVGPDDIVTLQIDQTVAEVVGILNSLTPTTNKTIATTRVHVPNGCFLVMSGHIRDQESCIHSGIPCLGSLPLIGPTFSRNVTFREKRNLIMFIRPHVISNIQQGMDITNEEGYDYNWDSNPCSIIEVPPPAAPECETCPPPFVPAPSCAPVPWTPPPMRVPAPPPCCPCP